MAPFSYRIGLKKMQQKHKESNSLKALTEPFNIKIKIKKKYYQRLDSTLIDFVL